MKVVATPIGLDELRPSQGNRTRGVESADTRARILAVVEGLVVR